MTSFHGDDIDRMLEGQSSAYFGGETPGGPPGSGPPAQPRRRSRERDRRQRSRSRDRDRSRRRERDRLFERTERLDRERERDQRTVFAAQIHPKNEEREIFEFFSEVGKVIDIQLIRDTRTYKSKGLAYVEFEDRRSVPHALALSGRNLNGYPVLVQMTQSDRGYAVPQQTVSVQPSGTAPGTTGSTGLTSVPQDKPKTLHITNLHKKLTEDDVTPIFSAFGEVRDLEMIMLPGEFNEAYITFRRGSEATTAMVQLNGLEVVGKQISVEQAGEDSQMRGGGDGAEEARDARFEDESGNGGVVMSLQDKRSLIQNLARSRGIAVPDSNMSFMNPGMKAEPAAPARPAGPRPTPCLLLKNMFNPATETDPDFDLEIREDVREEVSSHGRLLHIYVDKNSRDGRVYLKFEVADASEKAYKGLDGRWFAQNRIEASYMEPREYGAQFPGA